MLKLNSPIALGQEPDRVQELVTQATSAFLEWLSENWILAPGGKSALELARVEVFKDWYGSCWNVRFTMEDAPWFGDSVTLDMEEIAPGEFRALITEPQFFYRTNIQCVHGAHAPQGHWRVNPAPSPSMQPVSTAGLDVCRPSPRRRLPSRRWPPRGESVCFAQRPRDLGWADSRHWMEEE